MESCYFSQEFERMSLAGACHSQRDAPHAGQFAIAASPAALQPAEMSFHLHHQQQQSPATSPGMTGMRKKPRFLTVMIPNGITDDTSADAYQRSVMTPSESPQTPWRIGSDSDTDMQ